MVILPKPKHFCLFSFKSINFSKISLMHKTVYYNNLIQSCSWKLIPTLYLGYFSYKLNSIPLKVDIFSRNLVLGYLLSEIFGIFLGPSYVGLLIDFNKIIWASYAHYHSLWYSFWNSEGFIYSQNYSRPSIIRQGFLIIQNSLWNYHKSLLNYSFKGIPITIIIILDMLNGFLQLFCDYYYGISDYFLRKSNYYTGNIIMDSYYCEILLFFRPPNGLLILFCHVYIYLGLSLCTADFRYLGYIITMDILLLSFF